MRIPLALTSKGLAAHTTDLALLLLLFSLSRVASCTASPILGDKGSRLLVRQASSDNLQSFGGELGGKSAAAIVSSGDDERIFDVDGDTFVSVFMFERDGGQMG